MPRYANLRVYALDGQQIMKKMLLLTRAFITYKEEGPERDLRVEALDWRPRRDSNPRPFA